METQNITLSLPKDILLKARLLAVTRRTSVSRLVTTELERLVQQEDAYADAQRRHFAWLEHAADLGTQGQVKIMRDELHERR